MRLQLSSFAWRILNVPVADFTAASSAKDNSMRDPKGSKHHGSPSTLASLSAPRPLWVPKPQGSPTLPQKAPPCGYSGYLGEIPLKKWLRVAAWE